ncbi:hypothetical protein H8D57_02250, partial [bacterium]|nr:hypothetical protein [bacterium]
MNILNAKSLFILMLCFIVTTATSADPVISVNINAIEAELNSDDVEERSITITNDGDELLEFSIDHEILNEPEEAGNGNPGGPLRDDLGDEIAEYEFDGEFDWTGLAWDGELMWGMDIGRQRMVAFDPVAEEVVESVFFNSQFFGFAYDGEAFWSCRFGDPNQGRQSELVRINRDGEIIATIEIQGGIWPLGVAFDGENLWYYSIDFEVEGVFIRQIALNGEEIRAVDCREIIQDIGLSIAWVNEHDDGQLWVKVWEGGTLYQINIDGEDPEVVQQADLEFGEVSGLEHDGENMWYTSAETDLWYVVDDGIMEDHWLTYEPREGEIEEDSDTDIIVTLDAADLIEGMYEADM